MIDNGILIIGNSKFDLEQYKKDLNINPDIDIDIRCISDLSDYYFCKKAGCFWDRTNIVSFNPFRINAHRNLSYKDYFVLHELVHWLHHNTYKISHVYEEEISTKYQIQNEDDFKTLLEVLADTYLATIGGGKYFKLVNIFIDSKVKNDPEDSDKILEHRIFNPDYEIPANLLGLIKVIEKIESDYDLIC